ncbi:MAG: hypothetical protein IKR04_07350, partial [Clostridia bacterium]|nr:hypothetical protein [Clostridia bacterium]
TAGLRNNNATDDLIISETSATVDAFLKQSISDNNWELYINGNQLSKGKYWIATSFIIDDEEYAISEYYGKNAKICSGSGTGSSSEDASAGNGGKSDNGKNNGAGGSSSAGGNYGAAYYSRKESYQVFDHEAEYQVEITSDKYDVQKSIPTSEKIKTEGWIDNADYYIKARTTTYEAGVKNVSIKVSVSYNWGQYEKVDGVNTWVQKGSRTEDSVKDLDFSVSIAPAIYYDVPVSDTAVLTGGIVNAADVDGKYKIGACSIPSSGIMGKGSSAINFVENFVSIDKEYQLTGSVGGTGKYTSESAAKSAAKSMAQSLLNEKKNAIIQTLLKGLRGDKESINYNFCGLKVNSGGISGTPNPGKTSFSNTSIIPSYVENGTYIGNGNATFSNNGVEVLLFNDVIVHTPVVAQNVQLKVQDFINQKDTIDPNRIYLQLDGEFEILIPDDGSHINEKNYGSRSYNTKQGENGNITTWGSIKDVKLPFDAYITSDDGNKKYFIAKNTWLSDVDNIDLKSVVDLSASRATKGYKFTIPVWVDEKLYQNDEAIEVRVIAENALDRNGNKVRQNIKEENANLDITNYAAYKKIPVEVLGEIYDLQVTHTNDMDWNGIQSGLYKKDYVLANEFPFGNTYKSGQQLSQNVNASYPYAPKLGYSATISMKIKGRKSNGLELATKKFSFVSKNGGSSQEVDLWYKSQVGGSYIKIVPGANNIGKINLVPSSGYINASSLDYVISSQLYSKEFRSELYNKYYYSHLPYNYSQGVEVGGFGKIELPQQFRFVYNNLDEYDDSDGKYMNENYKIVDDAHIGISDMSEGGFERILGSVGTWYGSFGLPNTTVATPKGANPNSNASSVLKNGYILVSFDITSKYNVGDGRNIYPYLNYKGSEARYKKSESADKAGDRKGPSKEPEYSFSANKTIKLGNGKTATVPADAILMFESDMKSNVDYSAGGMN